MQNNLEGISFDEVRRSDGVDYSTFRKNLQPIYSKVYFDIIKSYFFLVLVSGLTIYASGKMQNPWWIVPASAILIGYIAANISLFIHEAGHFNIHRHKKTNDRLANFMLCLPFGLSMKAYRKIHWQHHMHLGTPQDAETSYFNHISPSFLLESLTGIHLVKIMLNKNRSNLLTPGQKKQSLLMLAAGILFHSIILIIAILSANLVFVVSWTLGFLLFFPFFATIRQVLEHRDEHAKASISYTEHPHGKLSRLFNHNFMSSSFGAAGFTRHMIHHWDPFISYTRLKDIEAFLRESERTADIIKSSRTKYSSVFFKLLKAGE